MTELKIPQAPDFLFKSVQGHNINTNEGQPIYLIEKMEAVQHYGMCIHYTGVPYVKKGFPTPEALFAMNQIKLLILYSSYYLKKPLFALGILLTPKNRLLDIFNASFDKIFFDGVKNRSLSIGEEWMCRSAYNFSKFIEVVLVDMGIDKTIAKNFAFNLGQIFEYDDAYRYRFQDIMTELDVELFKKNPTKELKRLVNIFKDRTLDSVYESKKNIIDLFIFSSYFLRKHFIKHVDYLKKCERDESDWYWSCLRGDNYLYKGMSKEDCHKQFTERPKSYHIVDKPTD